MRAQSESAFPRREFTTMSAPHQALIRWRQMRPLVQSLVGRNSENGEAATKLGRPHGWARTKSGLCDLQRAPNDAVESPGFAPRMTS